MRAIVGRTQAVKKSAQAFIDRLVERLSKTRSIPKKGTGDDETFDWWDMTVKSREVQKLVGYFSSCPRDQDEFEHQPSCIQYHKNSEKAEKSISAVAVSSNCIFQVVDIF